MLIKAKGIKSIFKGYIFEIIFSLFFLVHYLPYFIIAPVPMHNWDSHAYVLLSMTFENIISLDDLTMDLPYGLSLIIWLCLKLGFSLKAVVIVQVLLSFFSSLFLIYTLRKILNPKLLMIYVVFFSAFITNSDVMLHSTSIATESLYTSFLILLAAFICQFWTHRNVRSMVGICFSILMLIFIRSTGIMYLYIPLLIVVFYWFKNNKLAKKTITLIILVLLANSSVNLIFKGYFFPGDYNRLAKVFLPSEKDTSNQNDKAKKKIVQGETLEYDRIRRGFNVDKIQREKNRSLVFVKQVSKIADSKLSHFYYFRLLYSLQRFNSDSLSANLEENKNLEMYLNKDLSINKYLDYFLSNYDEINVTEKKLNLLNTDVRPRNPFLFGVHVFHELQFFFRNWIIVLLASVLFLISLYMFFLQKQINYFLAILIGSIYYSKLFAMTFLAAAIDRYVQVTEFSLYLFIILSISFLLKDFNSSSLKIVKHATK